MSNTVILAVDPSDLQTVDALTLAGPLTALVAVVPGIGRGIGDYGHSDVPPKAKLRKSHAAKGRT